MTKFFFMAALLPFMAFANTELTTAQAELIKKLEIREMKLQQNALKLNNLRSKQVTPQPIKVTNPEFNTPPLQCIKSAFPWFFNDYSMEYLDCTFKLNIGNPHEIQRLLATLKIMKEGGWDVGQSEVFKQNIVNENKIMNEERYRFIRKKTNKSELSHPF